MVTSNTRLTYKQGIDGYEDVGLRPGVTVGEAICKLADLEEAELTKVVQGEWLDANGIRESKCSQCGVEFAYVMSDSCNYCPSCGMKTIRKEQHQ